MKRVNLWPVLLSVLMVGCLEINTMTQVNPDGSVERTIDLKGSARSISETSFNIPRVDVAMWEITQDSIGDDKYHYQARRNFNLVDDMNASFEANTNAVRIKIKSDLTLSQGLFFTRYYYEEKLWADIPGPDLPMEDYLSDDELQSLILNDTDEGAGTLDSVEAERLERQLDLYFQHRIYEDFANALREGARRIDVLEQADEILNANLDSIKFKLNTTNYYDGNDVWESILEGYMNEDLLDAIHESNPEGFEQFYNNWQFFEDVLLNDYSYSIELPGVIRETSALDVRGNRMSWEPEAILLFFGGVTLSAESSIVNIWSVVITAILFFLTLIVTVISFARQRKP